jgi:hypothetical protein
MASSITRALGRRALSTATAQQSMYYNTPQRNMDEADKLRGLDQERADEKSLFFKLFNKYADAYYRFVYKNRPNSSFVKIFEANKFCRLISVDGIPGSGYEQVAKDLAEHKNLLLRERPSLYYFFERFGRADTPLRRKLQVSGEQGGIGNYWQQQYNMNWSKVYDAPGDWRELCKTLSWQLRSYRLQEADTVIEHLLQMRGIVSVQNYWSMRAEIHACGETGRIPADMHQSFIDQWNHMEGMLNGYPVGIYIDIEPEIAYQNIQNSEDYTEAQKTFYSLEYLRAYKEGYEQFVLPHINQFDTNMHTFTPDQITNSTDLCDIMIEKDADMTHFNNFWHMKNSFRSSGPTSEKYNILLHMHMDIGQNQMVTSRLFQSNGTPESLYIPNGMDRDNENGKASKIISWKYPREGIDGNGWHWDNDTLETNMMLKAGRADGGAPTTKWDDIHFLNKLGDGYTQGQNDGDEQKNGLPAFLNTLFNSTHTQMRGGVGMIPGQPGSGRGPTKQTI